MSMVANKQTFIDLVGWVARSKDCVGSGDIYTLRRHLCNYTYDYRHIIRQYLKANGCKIHSTNNNWWDNCYYIYYSIETDQRVEADIFFDEYMAKPFHITADISKIVAVFLILSLVAYITWMTLT